MLALARDIIQVALLVAVAIFVFVGSGALDIGHIPLCEPKTLATWLQLPRWLAGDRRSVLALVCGSGDTLVWVTAIAMVLFAGRRHVSWIFAPTLCLMVVHAWIFFENGWPTASLEDGTKGTDWGSLGKLAALYAILLALVCVTYWILLCVAWILPHVGRPMQRIATIRPGLVPAIARFCRHGALAAVVLSVTIGLMWFSWSFTDSYQFMQIRREAWSSVMEDPGGWALLAREVGAPMPEVDGSISARTLAFLASQDPDPGQRDRYRTLARSRAELDCDRAPHNCQEWIAEFSRAGLRSEGLAIAARLSPRCDKAIDFSSDDPLYTASRIIRICREAGNDAAALTAWNAAMSMHDASQDMRRRQFRDFLEQIPSDAPVPPPEFVFEGLRTDSPYRNERAGALFRGLARSGRVKEAIEYFQGLDAGDLSDSSYFFPKKPEQPVKYKLELLTQLEPVVRARFRGSTNEYALGQWLQVLSRELAGANDPEGALKLLPANGVDGDVVAAIADAFSRSGLFQRALETLQKLEAHVYGSTPLKEARGRACIEMARESQADVCMKMLKSLRGPDRTKVLALSGLALVKAGRHAAGVALLDTAEAHANGASGIARDEFEVVEVLAEAGRLRQARLISLKLLDREHRAAAYLSVCQRITGWSRSLGIFLSNWLGPLRPAK